MMNINELTDYLLSKNVKPSVVNGKINGLTVGQSSDLSASEAWDLVEQNGLKADEDNTPPPPWMTSEQDWGQFRLAMLNDEGYKSLVGKAITTTGGTLLVLRVESEIREQDTHLPSLQSMWKMVLSAAPLFIPGKVTIDRWNKHCTDSRMPFKFAADGSIVLL